MYPHPTILYNIFYNDSAPYMTHMNCCQHNFIGYLNYQSFNWLITLANNFLDSINKSSLSSFFKQFAILTSFTYYCASCVVKWGNQSTNCSQLNGLCLFQWSHTILLPKYLIRFFIYLFEFYHAHLIIKYILSMFKKFFQHTFDTHMKLYSTFLLR